MKSFFRGHNRILTALFMAFIPLAACILMTRLAGKTINDVSPAASEWNDELFYFKQVECMVSDTVPAGYFGYNESTAENLSFGAWSPLILVWWALFSRIFGFSWLSMIWANILIMSVSMFLFSLLSRLDFRRNFLTAGLFLLTTPLSRYMLSYMPEIVIISLVTILMGLVIGYDRADRKTLRLVMMLFVTMILTLLRPYMAVFFLFPFTTGTAKDVKRKLSCVICATVSVVLYFVIEKRYTAPYFTDVYSTEWISEFKNFGFLAGIKNIFVTIGHYFIAIGQACYGAIKSGYAVGIYFFVFVFLTFLFFGEWVRRKRKKCSGEFLALSMFVCDLCMLGAIVFMYSLHDGFRHLLIFIVAGEMLVAGLSEGRYSKEIVTVLVLFVLFVIKAKDPVYFRPYYDNSLTGVKLSEVDSFNMQLESRMLSKDELSWDNTVCMVFSDCPAGESKDKTALTCWQYGYSIPEGFAISYCESGYVKENIDDLKCRYVFTMAGGSVEELIKKRGECIGKNGDVSVYRLRRGLFD